MSKVYAAGVFVVIGVIDVPCDTPTGPDAGVTTMRPPGRWKKRAERRRAAAALASNESAVRFKSEYLSYF